MLKNGMILALLAAALPLVAGAQETRSSHNRDIITREEIRERALDTKNAYDVVRRLRPHFLRERSTGSISSPMTAEGNRNTAAQRQPVQVYVNGAKTSVPNVSLREIHTEAIIEILYLNASDATTRFGTGHENGAILVKIGA